MLSIVYSGDEAKKISSAFKDAQLVDARKCEEINGESDVLGFIIPLSGSSLPLSIENYINTIIRNRENRNLGYIFAIFLPGEQKGTWAANRLSSLLSDSGCILSYYAYYDEEKKNEILRDVESEKFRIAGNGLFYRLFRKNMMPYED